MATPPNKTYARNGNYIVTLQALNPYCGAAISRQVTVFVVGTKELGDTEGGVIIFPNPTDGQLVLNFENKLTSDYQLVISNTTGQILKNSALTREAVQTLDLQNLARGVYFLRFSNDTQQFVKRIVKM